MYPLEQGFFLLLLSVSLFGKALSKPFPQSSSHVSLTSPHHRFAYGFGDGPLISPSRQEEVDVGGVFGAEFSSASAPLHQSRVPHQEISSSSSSRGAFTFDLASAPFDDFSILDSPSTSSSASSSAASFSSNFGSSIFTQTASLASPSSEHFDDLPFEQLLLQQHPHPSSHIHHQDLQFPSSFGASSPIDLQATHSKLDFTQLLNPIESAAPVDPYLITGAEAKIKVSQLFKKRLFWKDIKHANMLLKNQQERRENGLADMVLGSNRPASPFYHGNKLRSHPTEG